jgi:phage shock protein C
MRLKRKEQEEIMQERIYRSKNDRIIAGICGGLAKYFDIDPAIVRIIFILLFFFKGVGFLAYIIMWIVIPTDPHEMKYSYNPGASKEKSGGKESFDENDDIIDAEIIDEEHSSINNNAENNKSKTRDNRFIVGVILIILGGLFLLKEYIPSISMEIIIPLIFIGIGAYLLLNSNNEGVKK